MDPNDENYDYRSSKRGVPLDVATAQNEKDLPALVKIKAILDDAITDLYMDFNAFNLKGDIKSQIKAHQIASNILVAVQSQVQIAIEEAVVVKQG